MESRFLIRIRQLGPHAQLREQHPENIKALLDDLGETFKALTILVAKTNELVERVNGLSIRVSALEATYSENKKKWWK